MKQTLSPEEEKIIDYIESGEAKSIYRVQGEITRYTQMAKGHTEKKKAISIRISESDLYLLKKKALETGLSYQNIIQSLIHQYTHGRITPTL